MVDNRTDGHDEQSSHPDWDVEPARTEDSEHTQDSERTGATAAAQVAEHDRVVDEPVYRDDHAERVGNDVHDERADAARAQADAERERLVAERAARREARLAALAPAPEPEPVAAPAASGPGVAAPAAVGAGVGVGAAAASNLPVRTETVTVTQRSTDKFAGSLGLFLLRLVVAAIVGIRGLYHLLNLPATTEMIQGTVLPYPGILAIVLGAAEVAIAIALVFGLLTRLAGLGLILVAGGALGFVLWGPWSPFTGGQAGFAGELELLLVAVGVLFLLVGAGGWSVDHGFRARRTDAQTA